MNEIEKIVRKTVARVIATDSPAPLLERRIDRELDTRTVVVALLGLWGFALLMISLPDSIPEIIRAPPVVLALTFVPGGLVWLAIQDRPLIDARAVLYSLGVSLVLLMAFGAIVNIVLPPVGFRTPMRVLPLTIAISLLIASLAVITLYSRPGGIVGIRMIAPTSFIPLAFLLLPLSSVLGVSLLNRTGNNLVLLLVLLIIAAIPLLTICWVPKQWHTLAIWTVSLAVVYHKVIWQYTNYGGQPYGILVWVAGWWSPGVIDVDPVSAELLPNGVLFPLYAVVTRVHILTEYQIINPFIVSFLPVALFIAFEQFVDSRKSFLGASLFVFAHPFYIQYPSGGRVATPVLFLALFGLVLADKRIHSSIGAPLGLLFLSGVTVSHYGTAYYVVAALFGALPLLFLLSRADQVRDRLPRLQSSERLASLNTYADKIRGRLSEVEPTDRLVIVRTRIMEIVNRLPELQPPGESSPLEAGDDNRRDRPILTWSTVAFFYVGTLAWYFYMRRGRKFDLLPKRLEDSYLSLVEGSLTAGRTANRIQKDYGTLSVKLTKYIYFFVAALMMVGFLIVLYRRLSTDRSDFNDQYLAVGASLFAIFTTTIIAPNWGGGRPMMITFSFTTIFAVVGAAWFAGLFGQERGGEAAFAVLLAVLFVLGSGVGSATVLGGFAPSNVPVQNKLIDLSDPAANSIVYKETDIETHVWITDHYGGGELYGDTFANRQKDWYRPELTMRTEGLHDGYDNIGQKPLDLHSLREPGVEPGYAMLLGHNLANRAIYEEQYSGNVTTLSQINLAQRDRVYTTGQSAIYYYNATNNVSRQSSIEG